MNVAAWLNRLGLEQYEQAFRENDVDAEVLPELTAEDLIGLGVTSIGHRRKLLVAITDLREKPPPANAKTASIAARASQEDLRARPQIIESTFDRVRYGVYNRSEYRMLWG